MTVEEIKKEYDVLEEKLIVAASTADAPCAESSLNPAISTGNQFQSKRKVPNHQKKSTIFDLRCAISQLQDACPHMDEKGIFNLIEGHCPYCNKKL